MTKRKTTTRRRSKPKPKPKPRVSWWQTLTIDQKLDLLGFGLTALAGVTLLSMLSPQQGKVTGWWLHTLKLLFGWGEYAVPVLIGGVGLWLILRRFGERVPTPHAAPIAGLLLGFMLLLVMGQALAQKLWPTLSAQALATAGHGGGLTGAALLDLGTTTLGPAGVILVLFIGWLIALSLLTRLSPVELFQKLAQKYAAAKSSPAPDTETQPEPEAPPPPPPTPSPKPARSRKQSPPKINTASRTDKPKLDIVIPSAGTHAWKLPDARQMLKTGSEQRYNADLIRRQSTIIEETLRSLGAPVQVIEINRGPVITQFGVEPLFVTNRSGKTTKVKVSKIAGLADDLALALSARSIRVQAPIPGKGLLGIEIPNEEAAVVSLRDVIESESFASLKGRLKLGLGLDVSGQPVTADLRKMPHLLIAGATGAGKSVCVNAIIAALLLQNSPDTLRLLMVDPKRVELTQFNGIPHLLTPVIVNVERVVPALRWAMREMDARYRRFAKIGARNIEDYNRRIKKLADGEPIPYIVVIIDELADLMLQSPEETERVICRLAQMSRATGIHLIIATQRPSVDVVTGLIKANFPARIAFAVASSIDSRVILDVPGAERLLGRGDMLFMPPDVSQPQRLQGAFVSDEELDALIDYWRKAAQSPNGEVSSTPTVQVIGSLPKQPALFPEFTTPKGKFKDDLLPDAVRVFLNEDRASVSLLQRRLRIGYTRSARLVEELSEMGIVTTEKQGQFRKVNRVLAEELLHSLEPPPDADGAVP